MTLRVDLKVRGELISSAVITNVGHPETGEHPADDDERRYEYTVAGKHRGTVTHNRGDGAWELVRRVLTAVEWDKDSAKYSDDYAA